MRTIVAALPVALLASLASAQTLRTTLFASGFARPTNIVAPPGDTTRMLVTEQHTHVIKLIKNGVVQATPFMTAPAVTTGNEEGLLGLAFHPDYANNRHFYIYYTNTSGAVVIAQYTAFSTFDTADPASGVTLVTFSHPQSNHNGGCLQFGPDGYLYAGVGDGGNSCDTGTGHAANGNGQTLTTYLGKILRLDVDNPPSYVPAGNPFATSSFPLIWDYGIRNPWKFSFDRLTGDLYIGDVGQNAVEEIDFEPAGSPGGVNYGWRCFEGNSCSSASGCSTTPCACSTTGLTFPIQTYTHSSGCSITGGVVYRGSSIPGLEGTYFYADYCTASIWSFKYAPGPGLTAFTSRTAQLDPPGAPSITSITSFGEDANGEVYIVEQGGEIWRIVGLPPGTPNCAGDGSLSIDCPCGNIGTAGRGCANSANAAGALLSAVGDVAADTVRLDVSGMPATTTAIFLQGDAFDPNGASFGDGILCATGNLVRLRTRIAVNGAASFPDSTDTITLSARGGTPPGSGVVAEYQAYYRNASPTFCPPETFNISNGYTVTW